MEIFPDKLSSVFMNDTAKLEKAFALASANPGSVLRLDQRNFVYTRKLRLVRPCGLTVVGNGYFKNLDGPGIELEDSKLTTLTALGLSGGGITAIAKTSLNLIVERTHVQEADVCYDVQGIGGADASCLTFRDSYATVSRIGWRVKGPNALDVDIVRCRGSALDTGADLRQGGAGYVIDHFGVSHVKRVVWANGGYMGTIRDITSENCSEAVVEVGGNGDAEADAGGWAQDNTVTITMLDNRGMTGDLIRLGCDAVVDAGYCKGRVVCRRENMKGHLAIRAKQKNVPLTLTGDWAVEWPAVSV